MYFNLLINYTKMNLFYKHEYKNKTKLFSNNKLNFVRIPLTNIIMSLNITTIFHLFHLSHICLKMSCILH